MLRTPRILPLLACLGIVACNMPMTGQDAGTDVPRTDSTTDSSRDASDSGSTDGGTMDSGSTDSGTMDSGSTDAGMMDSGTMDTGTPDSGTMDSGMMDSGTPDSGRPDSGMMDSGTPDSGTPDAGMTTTSQQIAAVRAVLGNVAPPVTITGARVTYLKPAIATTGDPAGFFVQADQAGPALFVEVDPATTTPALAVGDVVNFTVMTTSETPGTYRKATMISGLTRTAQGGMASVTPLLQNVNAATDLATQPNAYESEVLTFNGTVATDFAAAGTGYVSAQITTTGMATANMNLVYRLPQTIRDTADLTNGCTFTANIAPMWRFNAQMQIAGWRAGDFTINSCPAPRPTTAVATAGTTVVLTFSRAINPTSVMTNGSQFMIPGLTVTGAAVSGNTITLTTGMQTSGTAYTVTVGTGVNDTRGTSVAMPNNTAMFTGFAQPAQLRINEVNSNITGQCDLIELRVTQGGSMNNIAVYSRNTLLVRFTAFNVAKNDYIVLHTNGTSATCRPASVTANETTSKTALNIASVTYATAFDWWDDDNRLSGNPATVSNLGLVLRVENPAGGIMDAVIANDGSTTVPAATTASSAETVRAAMQWFMPDGSMPAMDFFATAANFNAAAVPGMNTLGTAATGTGSNTIGRINNADTNDRDDWTTAPVAQTWGANNAGQTDIP